MNARSDPNVYVKYCEQIKNICLIRKIPNTRSLDESCRYPIVPSDSMCDVPIDVIPGIYLHDEFIISGIEPLCGTCTARRK